MSEIPTLPWPVFDFLGLSWILSYLIFYLQPCSLNFTFYGEKNGTKYTYVHSWILDLRLWDYLSFFGLSWILDSLELPLTASDFSRS